MVNEELIKVKKREGHFEPLDISKVSRVLAFASEGLNVSTSQVEMNARLQFFTGISTKDIHDMLIKSAADLIEEESPDYEIMAARLLSYQMRKQAYSQYTPPHLNAHIRKLIALGRYDQDILNHYSEEEINELNDYIDHSRDDLIRYAGFNQIMNKYCVKDREGNVPLETPQFIFMLVPMYLFANEKNNKLQQVKQMYDKLSQLKLTLPSPIIAGVRTITKQYSSCVILSPEDSLDGINAASNAIVKYIARRAGIGLNIGKIRAKGSKIRNGEATHTGIVSYIKLFEAAVNSCNQGNLRKGSATLYYPVWHLEVEDMLVLKNNKGTENTRARDVDYAVQLNKHFYEKARSKENNDYYLFSPSDVPGLYEAFFADQKAFVELYDQYVADETIRKKKVSAKELFTQICIERMSTGRIYVNNVDIMNINTPFIPEKAPIYSSNLCLEVALPTKPLQTPEKTSEGEIALCTLSAINCYKFYDEQGKLNHADLEETCTSAVRSLDALLSYQDYPVEQAREGALKRRSLGISTTNLAGLAAKLKLRYESPEFLNKLDEWMEALAYYCLKASNQLAKEKGKAEWLDDTTWQKGILPQDRANERARSLITRERTMDWETLRKDIVSFGLRNSTLLTQAPIEASSLVTHSTNGIEPPRALLSIKANKDGATKQLVPDYELYKDFYTTMWSLQNNDATLNISAVMQMWIDQAISTNLNYDPAKYPNRQIPVAQMMKDILKAYSLGIKTIYYCNIRDGQKESNVLESMGCDGGACAI
nr:MAG TPA: ribonucleotide-diphosphate reductase subunit alpha [Caudoviricetes sp.]